MTIKMLLSTVALAFFIHDGIVDRPSRIHGLAEIRLEHGEVCFVAARLEDLPTRGYVNRWHYLIEPPTNCPLKPFGPELRHTLELAQSNMEQEVIQGFGTIFLWPLDPEVRDWCTRAAQVKMDYPSGFDRVVTLRKIDLFVWELMIEEPAR